jgi:hypothetical protein
MVSLLIYIYIYPKVLHACLTLMRAAYPIHLTFLLYSFCLGLVYCVMKYSEFLENDHFTA